jgi:hypothetical protein
LSEGEERDEVISRPEEPEWKGMGSDSEDGDRLFTQVGPTSDRTRYSRLSVRAQLWFQIRDPVVDRFIVS